MKLPKLTPGQAIEIIWIDTHFNGDKGWMFEEEVLDDNKTVEIRSICQFLSKDHQYIYTVADRSDRSDSITGVMRDLKIPIGCIKSIRRLTYE